MSEVVDTFNTICLHDLSYDWVQAVYYSEFLEYGELPEEYDSLLESVGVRSIFRRAIKVIAAWLNSEHEKDETRRWTYLSQKFNYKSLLALLGYYIDVGNKNLLNRGLRNMSLLASRVYFKLLSIPGYKAYDVYHSQLFANCLVCLTYPKSMIDQEESYFNSVELIREVNLIIDQLSEFVEDLKHIITSLQLSATDMNFEDIVSSFIEIPGGAIISKLNIDKVKLSKVNEAVYELIHILICESGDNPHPTGLQILFKSMLPKLIAASVDSRSNNNNIRCSYISYCESLLDKYGKPAVQGFSVLIQHLCYSSDGLERVEVRSARTSLVTGLMGLLPQRAFRDTVKWLLKLSTTAKVSHRQIAMELLAKLLSNEAVIQPSVRATSHRNQEVTTHAIEEATEDIAREQRPAGDAIDDSQDTPRDVDPTENRDTPDVTEESLQEGVVDGTECTQRVTHAELVRALYERLGDASGTLRARALATLTECLHSNSPHVNQAIKDLEGSGPVSRLVAAAARCVCDERAAVRRAAALLLRRLLADTPPAVGNTHPPRTDYAMLVGLCRDASIIVRVAAIGALGELLLSEPSEHLVDAFITGPLHQLSDPELKIQEQVTSLVQQILLDRLRKYEPDAIEDPLPWMFLGGVVRHNTRRHLQKACAMLVKSSAAINERLVETVSSHITVTGEEGGTEDGGSGTGGRGLQCLVLLTCLARHVSCRDAAAVLDYYYRLEEHEQESDGRAAALVLELLGTWAGGIGAGRARDLRERLLRRLASAPRDGCRPAVAYLAVQLDPVNINWATELMQISERRALSGGSLEEWVRAADLSLVARAPPDPALLRLFLDALETPPPDWTEARRATLVAGAGRLCVRSRAAAAALAAPLAALLQDAAAPLSARHNALLALADVATRYSCIVEPQLPVMCGCLSADTPPVLRRAAARALTRLLLAGFLRLRTPLYYRFCALLADDDHDVREPAEYYVSCCLTVDTIYHHFVDCIVHYNSEEMDCKLGYDARQLIYDVMLQRLSAVQRLNVQCRLARELLAHAADLDTELPPSTAAALLDAITLLVGPRMRLPKKPEKATEAADLDDLQERVTTNIVSHKMKRTVAEVLVPAALRLYARVRSEGGQLVTYLIRLATDLLSDYRQEIQELFESDDELLTRVQQFQENIGLEPAVAVGNTRNLVTASAPPEPDTPRGRKRAARPAYTPRKRRLIA